MKENKTSKCEVWSNKQRYFAEAGESDESEKAIPCKACEKRYGDELDTVRVQSATKTKKTRVIHSNKEETHRLLRVVWERENLGLRELLKIAKETFQLLELHALGSGFGHRVHRENEEFSFSSSQLLRFPDLIFPMSQPKREIKANFQYFPKHFFFWENYKKLHWK